MRWLVCGAATTNSGRPPGARLATLAGGAGDFLIGAVLLYGYVYTAYKYGNSYLGRNERRPISGNARRSLLLWAGAGASLARIGKAPFQVKMTTA